MSESPTEAKTEIGAARHDVVIHTCRDDNSPHSYIFHPCDPAVKHTHGSDGNYDRDAVAPWSFEMSAWATVQERGHSGTGGQCLGLEWTKDWNNVLLFYYEHKDANYCSIMAQRQTYVDSSTAAYVCHTGTTQYVQIFKRCIGCGLTDFPDWVIRGQPSARCTGPDLMPEVVSPEEADRIAAALVREAAEDKKKAKRKPRRKAARKVAGAKDGAARVAGMAAAKTTRNSAAVAERRSGARTRARAT